MRVLIISDSYRRAREYVSKRRLEHWQFTIVSAPIDVKGTLHPEVVLIGDVEKLPLWPALSIELKHRKAEFTRIQ